MHQVGCIACACACVRAWVGSDGTQTKVAGLLAGSACLVAAKPTEDYIFMALPTSTTTLLLL